MQIYIVLVLIGFLAPAVIAEEQTLHLAVIGPNSASPFKPQLQVQVRNDSFTSFDVLKALKGSELVVDGKPYQRQDAAFEGPMGLPAQGTWDGCLGVEEYVPEGLPPGHHHLLWRLGKAQSEEIRVTIPASAPDAATPEERIRQVDALKSALSPGLRKSCVEYWLTDRDGGVEIRHAVRYYVDPDVKVHVPYDKSAAEPRINGPVKIYIESRVAD